MADLSGATQLLFDWLLSPLIWFVLIFVFLAGTMGVLWIRKRRKLIYEFIEIVDYDYGKTGFNLIKGGWFGKKKALRGFLDFGEEQLETQDGEAILNFSTEDFQEINGKRGIIITRDPVNPEILVPINNIKIKGKEMLAEIAPGDYRDASMRIIDDADRETKDWTEKIVQWVLMGMTIIFALVSIIVIAQMVKHGQTEASNLIIESGKTCLENAKEVCQQIATSTKGASP